MRKKIQNSVKFLLVGILFSSFTACSSDDNEEPLLIGNVRDFKYVDAVAFDRWVYFSFEKGDTLSIANPATDLSWDLAFHRAQVRTNGGKSGAGQGGVVKMKDTDWNAVPEVPKDSTFVKDEEVLLTGYPTMKETTSQSYSLAFEWVKVIPPMSPPTYQITNNIFIVKTAKGKYAKVLIYDRNNAKNEGGYPSFKYQYNDSGSLKFIE